MQVNRKYARGVKGFNLYGTKTAFRNYRKDLREVGASKSFLADKALWARNDCVCPIRYEQIDVTHSILT